MTWSVILAEVLRVGVQSKLHHCRKIYEILSFFYEHEFHLKAIRKLQAAKKLKFLIFASKNSPEDHKGPWKSNKQGHRKQDETKVKKALESIDSNTTECLQGSIQEVKS